MHSVAIRICPLFFKGKKMLALALLRQALRREKEKKKSNFPLFEGIVQQVEMLGDIFLKVLVNEDVFSMLMIH